MNIPITVHTMFLFLFLCSVITSQAAQVSVQKTTLKAAREIIAQKKQDASPKETKRTIPKEEKKPATGKKKTTTGKKSKEDKEKARKKKLEEADLKKAEWIERTIKFGTHKERKEAINYIPTVKNKKRKQNLEQQLISLLGKEQEPTVLVKAITIAEELKLKKAIPAILKLLEHESEDVHISVVYALKSFKATHTSFALQKILKMQNFKENSNYTQALIETLGEFKAKELKDFAIEKIKDNTTTMNNRLSLILFLGKSEATGAKDYLLEIFKDEDEETTIRSYAVNSLSKLNIKSVAPEINKVISAIENYPFQKKKEHYGLYMYCITALTRLGDKGAYPKLIDSLKSDNAQVRLKAISLLKDLKDKRSIDILKYKANYDPNPKVQREAKKALKEMGVDLDKEKKDKENKKKSK